VLTIEAVLFRADDADGGRADIGTHFAAGKDGGSEGGSTPNAPWIYAVHIGLQAKPVIRLSSDYVFI
jgi:hypothetical protein